MRLNIFIATDDYADTPWVVGAWDEWSVDENPTGYAEDVERQEDKYGANFRVAVVKVTDDFLESAFAPYEEDSQ